MGLLDMRRRAQACARQYPGRPLGRGVETFDWRLMCGLRRAQVGPKWDVISEKGRVGAGASYVVAD